jgi:hypothetical protein
LFFIETVAALVLNDEIFEFFDKKPLFQNRLNLLPIG